MAFRNPLYLDVQSLHNLADYFDVELPGDAQVTRRTLGERRGRAGLNKGLDIGGEKASAEEVTEVYSTQMRPVRAMNDVIDRLLVDGHLVDLTSDPSAAFGQRDIVQVDGELVLSPATEIGALMSALMPELQRVASQESSSGDDLDPAVLAQLLLGGAGDRQFTHVFHMSSDVPSSELSLLVEPAHLFGTSAIDDLEGELTVFGTVDRVIPTGGSFSLERHLLPGLNRTARRAIRAEGLAGLLSSFSDLLGKKLDASSVNIAGPAVVIKPIALY